MEEPMDREEQATIDDGQRVQMFLADDAVQAAFKRVEAKYHDAWRKSAPSDTAGREAAFNQLRALDDLRQELSITVDRGEVARHAKEHREKIDRMQGKRK